MSFSRFSVSIATFSVSIFLCHIFSFFDDNSRVESNAREGTIERGRWKSFQQLNYSWKCQIRRPFLYVRMETMIRMSRRFPIDRACPFPCRIFPFYIPFAPLCRDTIGFLWKYRGVRL